MSLTTGEKFSVSHAVHYLTIAYMGGEDKLELYQERFSELRSEYNLALQGPPNNGRRSQDKLVYISEIKEMKPDDCLHNFPIMTSGNVAC